uniref:Uncharacterized protein n=1 Tax=Leersia perrieri TaxID=77586 RepID=A0A0D9UWY9_9ORYZ
MAAAFVEVERWRARFRARVAQSEDALLLAYGRLTAALPYLEAPMLAGDAEAARDRIELALGALGDASNNLSSAMSYMKAAEDLALTGGATVPSVPLHRIEQLPVKYVAEENAGLKLREARMDAKVAYPIVELSRSHLEAVLLLLDHPGVPGVDDLIEHERGAAVAGINTARANAELGCDWAIRARNDLPGAN